MKARVSFPIVVQGPTHNGSTEHPAIITRVWSDPDHDTATDGPATVNATLFPDGGGDTQFQSNIALYESRAEALASTLGRRKAWWAVNS